MNQIIPFLPCFCSTSSFNFYFSQIYFIEGGEVEIVTVGPSELEDAGSHGVPFRGEEGSGRDENLVVVRVNKVSAGGAFGEADFLLGKNHR